jgi:hypothetical protein
MTLSSVSFAIKAGGAAIAALWLGLALRERGGQRGRG